MEPSAATDIDATDTEGTMVDFNVQQSPHSNVSEAPVSNSKSENEQMKEHENSEVDGAADFETGASEEESSSGKTEGTDHHKNSRSEVTVGEYDTDREGKNSLVVSDGKVSRAIGHEKESVHNLIDHFDSVPSDSLVVMASDKEGMVLHHGETLHGESEVDRLDSGIFLSIQQQDSVQNPDNLIDSGSLIVREGPSETIPQSSLQNPSLINYHKPYSHQADLETPSSSKVTDAHDGVVDGKTESQVVKGAMRKSSEEEIQEIVCDSDLSTPIDPVNEGGDAPEDADLNRSKSHHSSNLTHQNSSENLSHSTEPFSSLVNVSQILCHIRDKSDVSRNGEQSCRAQEDVLRALVHCGHADTHSRKQLKKLLRSCSWGPVARVRKVAWHLVCSHLHKLEKPYVYTQMEKEMFGDLEGEDIPVPSWPQQTSHHEDLLLTENFLNTRGKNTAHKILSVISQLSPDITYCPGLLPLVDLFLHYLDAADTFSCVFTLLHSTSCVYFTQTRVAFEASKRVMRDLAKTYAKSTYVSLVRNSTSIDAVFDNWMGWIYTDLPFEYVITITDSYLLEGIKILYRAVLALLILHNKRSGPAQRGGNSAQSISQFCQKPPVTPARLMKIAFKIRGFSRNKMMKLQKRHEGHLSSNGASVRSVLPRVSSSQSFGSTAASTAVSMTQANTKMMGLHDTGSSILSVDQLATIWSWLPPRHSIRQPILLFNSEVLGTSLTTLYSKIEFEPCTIIVIKAITQEVFGAFCAESWLERRTHSRPIRFFGTGETFLFTLVPERAKFEWVGKPDPHVPLSANMFQAGDHASLLIGGGNGSAIQLDSMMERCRTETCDTFNNPPLCPSMDFTPAVVEVFGLS